ncbi:alginate lyase family protein [Novipirellula artificiosorum]|uniref:Alginate lyase n=1 Tax=Novipirellula artificiosorum TaxID=2528016 RepID=A0A5C6DU17_9BACT|nr:alginate lyase family protein [Novipirellula artificiosorum]TWU39785.1 Alginate lyase [Novipirellula artificiosorum]
MQKAKAVSPPSILRFFFLLTPNLDATETAELWILDSYGGFEMKHTNLPMLITLLLAMSITSPTHAQSEMNSSAPKNHSQPPWCYDWTGCEFEDLRPSTVTVPPITRTHPRIVVTPEELVKIKADIAGKLEPRFSSWQRLEPQAQSCLMQAVSAAYTGEDTLQFIKQAGRSMRNLELLVMAYLIDGDPAYAAKAKEILLTWARATPLPGSTPTIEYRFPNAGMDVARGVIGFIYAYDVLYDDLTSEERIEVETWFRSLLPIFYTGIKRWDTAWEQWWIAKETRDWKPAKDPNEPTYFNAQYYQNHLTAHAMGILLVGYAVGDRGLVQFAVDCEENPRDMIELINGMILMKDKPPFYRDDPGPHQDGEIADRYRHVQGKGLGYAMLSFDEMLVMTETLYRNDVDLYQYVGAYGETMELPFTFYADFWRLGDGTIKGGYYSGERPSGESAAGRYEIGNQRYPGNPEIEAFLKSVDRAAADPTGLLCCPTIINGSTFKERPMKNKIP